MQWFRLYVKLQRFNASSVIGLFVLLGAAATGYLVQHPWRSLVAAAIAMLVYPAAVGLNDIADRQLDAINVADMDDRALMHGASVPSVLVVSGICAVISLVGAFWLNPLAGVVVVIAHTMAVLYSLPPAHISYRTLLAIPWLTAIYVACPYFIGASLSGHSPKLVDVVLGAGLYVMFMARILMKDFRDRKGDSEGGKVTFLLRFGKAKTITTSYILLAVGMGTVFLAADALIGGFAIVLLIPTVLVVLVSRRLKRASVLSEELVAIGVMARLGNAVLLLLLLDFVWREGASLGLVVANAAIILLALANWYFYITQPSKFIFGSPASHKLRQK
jgi:4-hydroxybenzoate polyprenyltransferase